MAVDSVHIGVGKWLKRQLEFWDEQRMIGSIRDVAGFFGIIRRNEDCDTFQCDCRDAGANARR